MAMLRLLHGLPRQVVRAFPSLFFVCGMSGYAAEQSGIHWESWSDDVFARAKAEHKFVLLDLGAVWCHWCHVMDEVTYTDEKVRELIGTKYIAVRVDQDSRPDLSNRYEDYGWPATVVFDGDRQEIVKRQGYIPPKPMASLLQAIIDDPTPGPSVRAEIKIAASADAFLTKEQIASMLKTLKGAYDHKRGGWGDVHKYLDWDAIEYCVSEGLTGNAELKQMGTQTLTAGLKLIDPVWGGVYQYSTDGDWDHPHFEKIMQFQAENLRLLSLASASLNDPRWLTAAQRIRAYLKTFLTSPEGVHYVSQDADLVPGEHSAAFFALSDAERRARGIPRIDTHRYSRENGLAITGLAMLFAASGDVECLNDAKKAAEWIIANRSISGGGFRHDEKDAAGPYLADTLAMARAFLALYTESADRAWLKRAQEAADFIDTKFRANVGFVTAAVEPGALPMKPQVDENIALTRFASMLHHHTGQQKYRDMAEHSMHYLAAPAVIDKVGFNVSGILLADRDLRMDPVHITIVGSKNDPVAQKLFATALRGAPSAQIEWFDRSEGPLPRNDVPYPELDHAAAFLCAGNACSAPMQSEEALSKKLKKQ